REPESAPGIDGGSLRRYALACLRYEREDVDLHARQLQSHLLHDGLALWQHVALIAAGDVVAGAVDTVSVARLRTHIDRLFGQPVERPVIGLGRLPDMHFPAVEHGDLELDVEAALAELRRLRLLGCSGYPCHIEHRDEPG